MTLIIVQKKTPKHVCTKSETEQLLSPEEIAILDTEPTTTSAKYRRTKLHNVKRQRKCRQKKQNNSSKEEEEESEDTS